MYPERTGGTLIEQEVLRYNRRYLVRAGGTSIEQEVLIKKRYLDVYPLEVFKISRCGSTLCI